MQECLQERCRFNEDLWMLPQSPSSLTTRYRDGNRVAGVKLVLALGAIVIVTLTFQSDIASALALATRHILARWGGDTSGYWIGPALLAVVVAALGEQRRRVIRSESALLQARLDRGKLVAELRRSELKLLGLQTQPQFLFNTLANIRILAHSDRAAAAEMLGNFMRYFAAAMPALGAEQLTLADERLLLYAYLRLHQMRMGDRLRYRIDIPEALAETRVPPMMLLTLVENSIRHGLRPLAEGGSIEVRATSGFSGLELRVVDSGVGITAETREGTGLANLRARLALIYGGEAQLNLTRASPRGLMATLRIPP